MTGRCLSADHEAESVIRQVYACMLCGQAAGIAAALSLKSRTTLANVDITALQSRLLEQNAVLG